MSTATQGIHEVFLSHGPHDVGVAEIVKRAFDQVGLGVVAVHEVKANSAFLDRMRKVLAECSALVLILTRSNLSSPDVPLKVGMAMGLDKPVYVLHDGIAKTEIPVYLREFKVLPLAKLPQVVVELVELQRNEQPPSGERGSHALPRMPRTGGPNGPVAESGRRRRTG